MSLSDSWQKETKVVDAEVMILYRDGLTIMGISVLDLQRNVVNEQWGHDGCVALTEAGEMKFFEPEECPSEEELQRWFTNGNTDLYDKEN